MVALSFSSTGILSCQMLCFLTVWGLSRSPASTLLGISLGISFTDLIHASASSFVAWLVVWLDQLVLVGIVMVVVEDAEIVFE